MVFLISLGAVGHQSMITRAAWCTQVLPSLFSGTGYPVGFPTVCPTVCQPVTAKFSSLTSLALLLIFVSMFCIERDYLCCVHF